VARLQAAWPVFLQGGFRGAGENLSPTTRGGVLTPAEIVFTGSTYVALEVDLEGKRVCADDISGAECYASSEWIRTLSERNPHDSFEGYLHFEIGLIPPGGTINILAKDFSFEPPVST
jgi:hypothetical protein